MTDILRYQSFLNIGCEFYPCHEIANFHNCMFCWCPLYLLDCKGNYLMINGIKDCSHCVLPHIEGGYEYVLKAVKEQVFSHKRQRSGSRRKPLVDQLRLFL